MKTNQFYCVSLKKTVTASPQDMYVSQLKNGRYVLGAICKKTGTKMFKFIKNDDVCKLKDKYGSKRKSKKKSKKSKKSCKH